MSSSRGRSSSASRSRTAFLYSARLSRCSGGCTPGLGLAAASASSSALEPGRHRVVGRCVGTRQASRRHRAGAQLGDDLFPRLRVSADRVQVERIEGERRRS